MLARDARPARALSTRGATLAFGSLLFLVAALMVFSLARLSSIHADIESITHGHSEKSSLLSEMHLFSTQGHSQLRPMLSEDTGQLQREALYLEWMRSSEKLSEAGRGLFSLDATSDERSLFGALESAVERAASLQREVAERAIGGDLKGASEMMQERAIPAQGDLIALLDAIQDTHSGSIADKIDSAGSSYALAALLIASAGVLSILLGGGAGLAVASRHKRIRKSLSDSAEQLQSVLHAISEAVITTDTSGRVDHMNHAAEAITGWRLDEARGRQVGSVFSIVSEDTGAPLIHPVLEEIPDGAFCSSLSGSILLRSRNGRERSIEDTTSPILDESGEKIGSVLVFRDVTESRAMTRDLMWASTHDRLTGLKNRDVFERHLRDVVASAKTTNQEHVLLLVDIDQFKLINDSFGHSAGDDLLRQLARRLKDQIRPGDLFARMGGDEFGILMTDASLPAAREFASHIQAVAGSFKFEWDGQSFAVALSIGIVPIHGDYGSADHFLTRADAACHSAKQHGQTQIHIDPAWNSTLSERKEDIARIQRIRDAVDSHRLWIFGQEISPVSGTWPAPRHTEILLRMVTEDGQVHAPGQFIPAAERYNLMPMIDRWVITRVMKHIAETGAASSDRYAINLSGQSICDPQILEFIVDQLRKNRVDASRVTFEITETAAIENMRQASHLVRVLRHLGCSFALDDFGAGMSSFGYLKAMEVDYIKIDGSFVKDIISDPVSRAMVESIHHIGRTIGLKTIAEFVETDDILDALKDVGIDYAQGFGVHTPEPLEAPPVPLSQPTKFSSAS